jgi:hypothetical protein
MYLPTYLNNRIIGDKLPTFSKTPMYVPTYTAFGNEEYIIVDN